MCIQLARVVYLWQREVELLDGVHHIQQHVVANHEFTLCVGWKGIRVHSTFTVKTV